MTVHPFALRKTTTDNADEFEDVMETIKRNLYVGKSIQAFRWDVRLDQFGFKIKMKDTPATRRGVLSVVSSVYDPVRFLAPFELLAKMLLQDL